MSLNRGPIRRYGIILNTLFERKNPISKKDLFDIIKATGEKVSMRNLDTDIHELQNMPFFQIPLIRKRKEGYIIEAGEIILKNLKFKSTDKYSIEIAEILLSQFKGLPIYEDFKEFADRYIGYTKLATMYSNSQINSIIQFDKTPQVLGTNSLCDYIDYI